MAGAILGYDLGEGDKITIGTKGSGDEMELSFKTKKGEPKAVKEDEVVAKSDEAAPESEIDPKSEIDPDSEIKSDLETEAPEEAEAD